MRAFGRIWDQITRERYGIENPKQRRFRYGVQVNSLGLTEAQPENNVQRIVLEMLAVTLSKDARARAVQLPAWNEALGLPRPWDQQWSLRIQQVLAHESDLLEYEDIFDGSHVIEAKVDELVERVASPRSTGSRRWAARWPPSSPATSSRSWSPRTPSGGPGSSPARRRSSASTASSRPSRTRSPPTWTPRSMTVDPANEARVVAALHDWRDNRDEPPAPQRRRWPR